MLQRSLELQPSRVEFIYNAGLCLLEMGQLEGAEGSVPARAELEGGLQQGRPWARQCARRLRAT